MQQTKNKNNTLGTLGFLKGGGEMGALIRAFDWDRHPLGNPTHWPDSLKTTIRLLLNSRFPMFIWWSKELYMFHNDAYLPALGNKHPAALGASARDMWAEIWQDLEGMVDTILNGGEPTYDEKLLLLLERKGFPEETYWTFSYGPAFDDFGEVNGIFCACHEVTATVLSERRLKSLKDVSEGMNQIHLLEQAGQLTCDILYRNNRQDLPFCLIYLLNNTATEATLIGKAGPIGHLAAPPALDLAAPVVAWALAEVLANNKTAVVDCAGLGIVSDPVKGQPKQVSQAAVLPIIRPGQNQVIGFFIAGISPWLEYNHDYSAFHGLVAGQIATSVTSVQAREELARQQVYLKEIFQQAPVGITIIRGRNHIIDLANPGVCRIWGRQPEEVLGKPVLEALPEVGEQGIIQLLDNVMNTGEPFIANELPLYLGRDGELEKVYLNFIYHPLRDSQGFIHGVIAVAIDISEQVTFRQSVETLNEELLATNADLDNFVYAASHDLKAPISNIEGLMHALVDQLPEDLLSLDTVKRVIELIQTSIDRFKRTVADLSEVTKLQRQATEDVRAIPLGEVVTEVQLDFEALVSETGARIETDIAPDAIVQFSAKNVRSIVYNLLSNALKYRSPERKPIIRIAATTTPDLVRFTVQDNGLGMDLAHEGKIFSMFKRLHDHVEGSGVGLYIVKRILENAGGSIQVESEVDVGSTFTVYFKR